MRIVLACLVVAAILLVPAVALAVPTLQLHMSNATYDPVTESWLTYDNPLTLEVIGAVTPAWVKFVDEVTLYISVPEQYYDPSGWITIQGLPSAPPAAPDNVPGVFDHLGLGGRAHDGFGMPIYEPDGYEVSRNLPPHDAFPAYFWEVPLPDLMVRTAGERVRDWIPDGDGWDDGDMQYYRVSYSGFYLIHFDLAGMAHNGSAIDRFAPFSHDADATGNGKEHPIPEPATLALVALGLAGIALRRRGIFRK